MYDVQNALIIVKWFFILCLLNSENKKIYYRR